MANYTVSIASKPGPYAQYSFDMHTIANNEDEAIERVFKNLQNPVTGAFPDRCRGMWQIKQVTKKI